MCHELTYLSWCLGFLAELVAAPSILKKTTSTQLLTVLQMNSLRQMCQSEFKS